VKYRAIRTECGGGHTHDSKIEAGRCDELREMEAKGEITHLTQQPAFTIRVNDVVICKYIADFGYRMADSGLHIVADVKGMITPVFRLKQKLVEASYPGTVITLWPPRKKKARKARKAK